VVDRTHLQLFTAKFDEHYPLASMDELADFYARQGVNRADFMRIATSEQTTAKMKSDLALIQKWQVDGTPTLVIDGKYRVLSEHVHTQEEMAAVALWLAKRELRGK
jgi:thiol:disulfide interchange protein DsbA